MSNARKPIPVRLAVWAAALFILLLSACKSPETPRSEAAVQEQPVTVVISKIERHSLQRQLTISSALIPFQEINVYAKEAAM